MEDFNSELFSSFFDDHLAERLQLGERTSFLHMDIEGSPGKLLFYTPSIKDVEVLSAVSLSFNRLRDARLYILWNNVNTHEPSSGSARNAVGFTHNCIKVGK